MKLDPAPTPLAASSSSPGLISASPSVVVEVVAPNVEATAPVEFADAAEDAGGGTAEEGPRENSIPSPEPPRAVVSSGAVFESVSLQDWMKERAVSSQPLELIVLQRLLLTT